MSETKQLESVGLVVEKLKSMHEKDQMVIISGIMNDGVHLTKEVLEILEKHYNPAFFDGDAGTTKAPVAAKQSQLLFANAGTGLRVFKDYLIYGTKSNSIKVIN